MANSTVLQIPNNLDDPIVLRRVLTLIVEHLDELKGNRGDDPAATQSQLVSTASNISELVEDLNALDNNYLRKDGQNVALQPISYDSVMNLAGLHFSDVRTVDIKVAALSDSLGNTYVKRNQATAPTLLAGNVDPATISAKVDELIVLLKNINILS